MKDPKPYKIAWRIKVKVIHSWVQDTNFGGDFLELILVDKSVSFIISFFFFIVLVSSLTVSMKTYLSIFFYILFISY